jgi:hypothetical protein
MAPTKPTMATTNAAVTNWDSKHKSEEDESHGTDHTWKSMKQKGLVVVLFES